MKREIFEAFIECPILWSDAAFKIGVFTQQITADFKDKLKVKSFMKSIILSKDIKNFKHVKDLWY